MCIESYEREPGLTIQWCHEDEMPPMKNDVFMAAFKASEVRDGVRMYPYIEVNNERFWLVNF